MSLSQLAGYAMSDSDEEREDMHKLTGNISGSDDEGSSHSNVPSRNYSPVIGKDEEPPKKKKPAPVSGLGLVSYGAVDEEESDPEGGKHSGDEAEDKSPYSVHSNNKEEEETAGTASGGGLEELSADSADADSQQESSGGESSDVIIPPSPPGSPPPSLKKKISAMVERRMNIDATIRSNKSFRNPSIYEKLLSHLGVDEKGTNYPPELFDPTLWDPKSSCYDVLAKAQNLEMEKRKDSKKDRVKVDFITATKPATEPEGGRKSKWDTSANPQPKAAGNPVGALIKK